MKFTNVGNDVGTTKENQFTYDWKSYSISTDRTLITNSIIVFAVKDFWDNVVSISPHNLLVLFKINHGNNYFSISKAKLITKGTDVNDLILSCQTYWTIRDQYYHSLNVDNIILSYKVYHGEIYEHLLIKPKLLTSSVKCHTYKGYKLPLSLNLKEWGQPQYVSENNLLIYTKEKYIFSLNIVEKVYYWKLFANDVELLSFTDTLLSDFNLTHFERNINGSKTTFLNLSKIGTVKSNFYLKCLKPLKKSPFINNKIITMDIETYTADKGDLFPYSCGYYDGVNSYTFYLTDYNNHDEMITSMLNSLMIRKYNNYKIYLHNFSNFDSMYLIKPLTILGQLKITYRDGKFLKIVFKKGTNKVNFYDSLLILPASLMSLGKTFGVETLKDIFPYFFQTKDRITYRGPVPDIKYFKNISLSEYKEYSERIKIWDMREETIKYLEKDLICLHQVISIFSKQIFRRFRVNILN